MTDPFSVTLGALSLLGVAEVMQKEASDLTKVIKNFKNAEGDLQVLKDEFGSLLSMLSNAKEDMKQACFPGSNLSLPFEEFLYSSLQDYHEAIAGITRLAEEVQKLVPVKLGAKIKCLKFAIGKDKIEKFRKRIQDHILILSIKQRNYHEALRRCDQQKNIVLAQQMHEAISTSRRVNSSITSEESAAPQTLVDAMTQKSICGKIQKQIECQTYLGSFVYTRFESKKTAHRVYDDEKLLISEEDNEISTVLHLIPAPWIRAYAYEISWHRGLGSSSIKLSSRNVVPKNSPCFLMAKKGDIAGLKELIALKKATPFDVSPDGRSLMHSKKAAAAMQLEMCQFLLHIGLHCKLEATRLDSWSQKPVTPLFDLVKALDHSSYYSQWESAKSVADVEELDKRIEAMVRFFLHHGSEPLSLQHTFVFDDYVGPWLPCNLLVEQSELALSGDGYDLHCWYTERLKDVSTRFYPEVSSRKHVCDKRVTKGSSNNPGFEVLGWSRDFLQVLSKHMSILIKNGADAHKRFINDELTTTPLQQILLLNTPGQSLRRLMDFLTQHRPSDKLAQLCHACTYKALMPQPAVDEWLDLLEEANLNLLDYGKREIWFWMQAIAQNIAGESGSLFIRIYDEERIAIMKDFFALEERTTKDGSKEGRLWKVGTFERRVRFHLDPTADRKFQITWEDGWQDDKLGQSVCFCHDDLGRKRSVSEIRKAELARWADLREHGERKRMAAMEEQVKKIPGGWDDYLREDCQDITCSAPLPGSKYIAFDLPIFDGDVRFFRTPPYPEADPSISEDAAEMLEAPVQYSLTFNEEYYRPKDLGRTISGSGWNQLPATAASQTHYRIHVTVESCLSRRGDFSKVFGAQAFPLRQKTNPSAHSLYGSRGLRPAYATREWYPVWTYEGF